MALFPDSLRWRSCQLGVPRRPRRNFWMINHRGNRKSIEKKKNNNFKAGAYRFLVSLSSSLSLSSCTLMFWECRYTYFLESERRFGDMTRRFVSSWWVRSRCPSLRLWIALIIHAALFLLYRDDETDKINVLCRERADRGCDIVRIRKSDGNVKTSSNLLDSIAYKFQMRGKVDVRSSLYTFSDKTQLSLKMYLEFRLKKRCKQIMKFTSNKALLFALSLQPTCFFLFFFVFREFQNFLS